MWFKQLRLFHFSEPFHYSAEVLSERLQGLAFTPCLPSLPQSAGWVSPTHELDAPLVCHANGYLLFCLQIEDKILPASVVRQAVEKKIQEIVVAEDRKVHAKEKYQLKNELTVSLLTRAFTKISHIYAYIDLNHQQLILGIVNEKKTEQFVTLFKQSVGVQIHPCEVKNLGYRMTHWLQHQDYPETFTVEKKCVLHDPKQTSRMIRCQEQNLFAISIQELIKDGCEVRQLTLNWCERVTFILSSDFSLQRIQFGDEVIAQSEESEVETQQQQHMVDFLIMTATLTLLLKELLCACEAN